MAALTKQEIKEIANQYIDKEFPTIHGNEINLVLNDKQAVERTVIFMAGFSQGLRKALLIYKS
jgi:hypothetical protein